MNKLVEHARRELTLINEYEPYIRSQVKAVEAIAEFGHSGGSVGIAIEHLTKLLRFENLSPLTDDPAEWKKIPSGQQLNVPTWQNIRNSKAFSHDGGITYYLLGEVTETGPNASPMHKSARSTAVRNLSREETSPKLVEILRDAAKEWGALGVALTAAELTDSEVLVNHLTGSYRPCSEPTDIDSSPSPEPGSPGLKNLE